MSKIDYQVLREAAERAIPAMERLLMLPADDDLLSEQELKDYGVDIDALNAFKFLAGPETVLALLDERERNQQYIKRRNQENEDIALTVGKLRVELEGKDKLIAELGKQCTELERKALSNFEECAAMAEENALLDELDKWKQESSAWQAVAEKQLALATNAEKRITELEAREVVLPSTQDVHPLGPHSAKIFCEFHRNIINRCADEIRKAGVNVSIKGE